MFIDPICCPIANTSDTSPGRLRCCTSCARHDVRQKFPNFTLTFSIMEIYIDTHNCVTTTPVAAATASSSSSSAMTANTVISVEGQQIAAALQLQEPVKIHSNPV